MTDIKEINYKGTKIEDIYKAALIGADFICEQNENGITVVNSFNKQLYIKTILLSRFLNVVELPEDRVMSIEQYSKHNFTVDDFKGRGVKRLKADLETFKDMLDAEISNTLACKNDALVRFNEVIAMEMTPEKLDELKNEQTKIMAEINKIGR